MRWAAVFLDGFGGSGSESRHLGTGREVLTGPEHVDYGGDDHCPDLL